jgi:hypothetical protein
LPCGGSTATPYAANAAASASSGSRRGTSQAATSPTTIPVANPIDTSWSTNFHHTKPVSVGSSDEAKASTAGSARPSFSPDSRFSEWRITRGTRGFVTTLDESTGSVGDSSAPSRNDSVHERSVSALVAQATSAPVIGIASTSLRSGRCHARWSISSSTSSPSRNRMRMRAIVASVLTKPERASK